MIDFRRRKNEEDLIYLAREYQFKVHWGGTMMKMKKNYEDLPSNINININININDEDK